MAPSDRNYYYCRDLDTFPVPRTKTLELVNADEANLIGSLCEDGLHRPVLDIDVPSRIEGKFLIVESIISPDSLNDLTILIDMVCGVYLCYSPKGLSKFEAAFPLNQIRFEPSSTPGHGHLYIDKPARSWLDYVELMKKMAEVGILEHEYVNHSISQGMSMVRPPWVKKKYTRETWTEMKLSQPDPYPDRYAKIVIIDKGKN